MKTPASSLCLLTLLYTLPALAQEPAAARNSEPPPENLRVLKTTEIKRGDHSIIFQRVEPPAATAPVAPGPPMPTPPLSAQEIDAQRRREAKEQRVLFLSATVFERRLTELSWTEDGKTYRAFSNLDFEIFRGMGELETADAIYTLMLALDSGTAESAAECVRAFPQVATLPVDRSAWVLAAGAETPTTPVMRALDAIHPFFDAHRAELLRAHEQRVTAEAERARQAREHPSLKRDTVIRYWRKPGAAIKPSAPGAAQ